MLVLLDSGPLGMVSHPKATPENDECSRWVRSLLRRGHKVIVPEISDYETRRELIRGKKTKSVQKLDALKTALGYVPINTSVMLKAAEFWARARNQGTPTAHEHALDGDMILCAQAWFLSETESRYGRVVVATTNTKHLALFSTAEDWQKITP